MTTLYEKIKGSGVFLFENLTPNEIETRMQVATSNSLRLPTLKAGSVFIFKGKFSATTGSYWGKGLVTKVTSEKLEFQFVLYNPDKSVAAKDDKSLEKSKRKSLGTVSNGGTTATVETGLLVTSAYFRIPSVGFANILLLN